jgi:uncharacterized SAM-binding protein YcdF (DUF218 family)
MDRVAHARTLAVRLRAGAYRHRRKVHAAVFAFAVIVAGWLAGFVWFTRSLPVPGPETPGTSDAIVVLTGGSDRLGAGLRLLADGRAKKLFVSGVYRGVDVAALLRVSQKSPRDVECCVVLGYAADNTSGNARETADWMAREGYTSLRLVTASYHMPRSVLEFRRAMPSVTIVPHPVFPERFRQAQWWRWPGTAAIMASEYTKYLLARFRLSLPNGL